MARRDREINIFNIAFLDVITGAMGAFVLLVVLLSPYVKKAQEASQQGNNIVILEQTQADLNNAKQQLDALKQQLDQLNSQNKHLTALDDQQQQQLSQLQQQAAQSTKQALDRAEQNMQQADQAVQAGDVEELKRLLAQARADLATARQQLDAMAEQLDQARQDLKAAQDENAELHQRLDQAAAAINSLKNQLAQSQQALAEAQNESSGLNAKLNQAQAQAAQMRQELAAAQQLRNQALDQRDRAMQESGAVKQTLDKAAPVQAFWAAIFVVATASCGQTSFEPVQELVPVQAMTNTYGLDLPEANAFRGRGLFHNSFVEEWNNKFPFTAFYLYGLPDLGSQLYFGVAATSLPPAGCSAQIHFTTNTNVGGDETDHLSWSTPVTLIPDIRPVLFGVLPLTNPSDPSLTPAQIATWTKVSGNGAQK